MGVLDIALLILIEKGSEVLGRLSYQQRGSVCPVLGLGEGIGVAVPAVAAAGLKAGEYGGSQGLSLLLFLMP